MTQSDGNRSKGTLARAREWVVQRPGTSLLLASALTLAVASAIAIPVIASKDSEVSDLKSQLADTSAELASTEAERDEAEAIAEEIQSRRRQIISDAEGQADKIVGEAEKRVRDLKDQIKEVEDDLSSKQSKLDAVTASLQQAQETKQKSTFSDGTWSVGEEILPGTYRSTAGGNCYWEILKSPSGGGINNIVDNGFGPNATITVSAGQWLRVSRCGEWSPGP